MATVQHDLSCRRTEASTFLQLVDRYLYAKFIRNDPSPVLLLLKSDLSSRAQYCCEDGQAPAEQGQQAGSKSPFTLNTCRLQRGTSCDTSGFDLVAHWRNAPARCRRSRTTMCRRSDLGSSPTRSASRASIVATFSVRTSDGAGRPAICRSDISTSPGQPRLSALVIISTQSSPDLLVALGNATTSAGRLCRTGRSVYGNGTRTTSQTEWYRLPLTGSAR